LADDAVLKNWSRRTDFVQGKRWEYCSNTNIPFDRETPDHALIWRKVQEDQGEPPGAGKALSMRQTDKGNARVASNRVILSA
jgi:hypothetical protein